MWTEPCQTKWSEVVHNNTPGQRHHHDGQFISDDDTVPSSQLDTDVHNHDDDDKDGAGSSDGALPAARGRYGRRYDPPDTVIIVKRPSVTERTQSVTRQRQQVMVTSGADSMRRPLTVDIHLALPLLALNWTTSLWLVSRLLFHRLSVSLAVSLYSSTVLQ